MGHAGLSLALLSLAVAPLSAAQIEVGPAAPGVVSGRRSRPVTRPPA